MPRSLNHRLSYRLLITGLAVSAGLLWGCSAGKLTYTPCVETSDCRDAFGRGWVCGEAGLCSETVPLNRCSSHPPGVLDDLSSYEDMVLLGSIFDQADFDIMVKSARLAVINVNTRDGLDGTPFGIIECSNEANVIYDTLDENEATAATGTYLSEALGVASIIGPATSTRAEVAYNSDSPFGTLHISPSATSPALTDIDGITSTEEDPGLLWRTAPPDSLQGQVIAMEMAALGVTRVGIVAEVGAYGEGLAEVFQQNFVGDGLSSELRTFDELGDLGPLIIEFDDPSYDGVLVISSSTADMASFLNGASAPNFSYDNQKVIFLPDGANDVQLLKEGFSGFDLFDDVRGTVPATPSGLAYNNFVAAYRTQYDGQDPSEFGFSAHAYDAGWLAIAGSAWSSYQEGGVITGLGTARGLRQVSDSEGVSYDLSQTQWSSIAASFDEGLSVDVSGASGTLNFDPDTGELTSPIDVWQIVCEDEAQPENCNIQSLYCVDLSDSPSSECCTEPGVNCPES